MLQPKKEGLAGCRALNPQNVMMYQSDKFTPNLMQPKRFDDDDDDHHLTR